YTAPAVSSLLKEIRLAGLVTVATSSTSKRINEVFLTAVGAELETKISQTLDARFKDVLRAASVNDVKLTEVLARIEADLSGKKEPANGKPCHGIVPPTRSTSAYAKCPRDHCIRRCARGILSNRGRYSTMGDGAWAR